MNAGNLNYLKELIYGQMEEKEVLAGFIENYVLKDKSLIHLRSDVCLISCSTAAKEVAQRVMEGLKRSFQPQRPERELSFKEMLGEV